MPCQRILWNYAELVTSDRKLKGAIHIAPDVLSIARLCKNSSTVECKKIYTQNCEIWHRQIEINAETTSLETSKKLKFC